MIEQLVSDLKRSATPAKAKILSRFFKTGPGEYGEGDKFLGVVVPDIRKIVRKYGKIISLDDVYILLASKYHEERLAALLIQVEKFSSGDEREKKTIFYKYLASTRYINNWDLIDLTAPHIVGAYLVDKKKDVLAKLARSQNLWERRIAILSTFHYIYRGNAAETLRIAKILLHDRHDLIQKAVGWMLREVGKRCSLDEEIQFLDKYQQTMPRTMLRYAIERFPKAQKKAFLAK